MFAYIKGEVQDIGADFVVLENNGVGFLVMTSGNVTSSLKKNQYITMYTHLNVREDDISIFGFLTKDELDCFRLLINISGIGPKGALAILTCLRLDELRLAVISEDYKAISKANGIGPKTAQRVVIELKDKFRLEDISYMPHDENSDVSSGNEDIVTETAQALVALGYSNVEALKGIKMVKGYESMTVEQLLKETLKKMALNIL